MFTRLVSRFRLRRPVALETPSPPSPGFLGERIYYRSPRDHDVEVACVDVATDWVPLFDIEVRDRGDLIEFYRGVRGYTEVKALAKSHGWVRREQRTRYDVNAPIEERSER